MAGSEVIPEEREGRDEVGSEQAGEEAAARAGAALVDGE